jgi:C_GCAxxG_C_C family probable redox protein
MNRVDTAVEFFKGGCACSQALLGAYGPEYGLDEDLAMRVASCFAGGMRLGETCGAVTGALMVLGLAYCSDDCRAADGRQPAYGAAVSFSGQYRARHGSLTCRDLLGCDISTPDGLKTAQEKGLFRTRCVELVRAAAELLETSLPAR